MAYRFAVGGTQVECDSFAELLAAAGVAAPRPGERHGRPVDGRTGPKSPKVVARNTSNLRKYWKQVHAYAKKHGVTTKQARKAFGNTKAAAS